MIRFEPTRRLRQVGRRALEALLPRRVILSRVSGAGPQISLTFDDGPDAFTIPLLDELDRLGIVATFFVVGKQCVLFPEALQEIARRGHELAGHGFTHKRFTRLGGKELETELRDTNRLLPFSMSGVLVRPPHGSTSATSLARCAALGFTTVLWSVDSYDYRDHDAATVAGSVSGAIAGDIVLMHEGQQWTIDALPMIAEGARGRGLEFCTVSELVTAAAR